MSYSIDEFFEDNLKNKKTWDTFYGAFLDMSHHPRAKQMIWNMLGAIGDGNHILGLQEVLLDAYGFGADSAHILMSENGVTSQMGELPIGYTLTYKTKEEE